MKKGLNRIAVRMLLGFISVIPPRTAFSVFLFGIATMLMTTTTSCGPRVSCYEAAVDSTGTVQMDSAVKKDSTVQSSVNNQANSNNVTDCYDIAIPIDQVEIDSNINVNRPDNPPKTCYAPVRNPE
ncbi:MAG: hypothetical protein A2W93_11215 [Bacteroidetes bacterium GWF2_43_63]|nr:MAG: hypothetical protein A2W94_14090 [Bacteroidetes bacterium GWE2_42_42]OFY54843.1 MAG: hypothetical protein A2W93_11215 [Bacteroidetes bacterium GWF2_43_63]HCB63254.1 hypothetical protein [Bacteroidales bacterium]HCY21996.1 hypothetical protein [Bacteroidales bacterium]